MITLSIYIVDQGKGVDMQKLKIKFLIGFIQTDLSKSEFHSGLGLSISKKIMESFFGSIDA